MGCTASVLPPIQFPFGKRSSFNKSKRRSSKVSVDTLETDLVESPSVKQRYGHPAYYKLDGYEVGLRFRVKSNFQSFFVGNARINGDKVTIKEHHLATGNEEEIHNEVMILSKLAHANIPKLSEVFITNISVFMVTEFIDAMRIRHYIDFKNKTTTLKASEVRSVIRSVMSATAYCHSNGIIIRNLTADNVMVRKVSEGVYETKIADFSQAVAVGCTKLLADHTTFEWADVPYTAPEALLGMKYSTSMDVWSIGVLLYTMLSAELPFQSKRDDALIEKIKFASFEFGSRVWSASAVSDKAKYLIGQMLVPSPEDRPSCKEIMRNEWVVMGCSVKPEAASY